jgi:hypothetical protein
LEQDTTVGSGVIVGGVVGVAVGGVPVAVGAAWPQEGNLNLPIRVFQLLLEVAE